MDNNKDIIRETGFLGKWQTLNSIMMQETYSKKKKVLVDKNPNI
jgi:hypothetical protein